MSVFTHLLFIASLFSYKPGQVQASSDFAQSSIQKPIEKVKVLNFGKQGRIRLDTQKGTFQVYQQTTLIIDQAFAEAKFAGEVINSKLYDQRIYSRMDIHDAYGKGVKHVLTSKKAGYPEMQQVYYTYPNLDYFFAEVLINGQSLKTNYLSPLVSHAVNIHSKGDNRSVFVPFDNDTFISYDAKSMATELTNTSAEVGAFYDNQSRKGLILGSVEHEVWKTGIKLRGQGSVLSELVVLGGYTDPAVTRDTMPHGTLSGNSIKSPKIFVGYFNDWREGLEAYAKANRKAEAPYVFNWTKPTPFGWNSWGAIQQKLSLDNAKDVVDFFADSLKAFRSGNTAYIDLDSYWDNMLSGGLEGDYTKLKQFADYCKSKGLDAGCYWAPFVDWGYQSKNKRRVEGSSYHYADIWTKTARGFHDIDGARALDPTHPGTRERIKLVIGKLKECGFTMIKIDFLGHASVEADHFYNKDIQTGMQAYKSGMEFLVDQLDGKMLIYAAISPNMATGRYVHMRRVACDAFQTIQDSRYTLNSLNYGWWQTYLYDFLDADHLVFGQQSLGANKVRLVSGLITGSVILGDDFANSGQWADRAKALLKNEDLLRIARNGKAFRPVEGNTEKHASEQFIQKIGDTWYVAVFNWDQSAKSYQLQLDRLGLSTSSEYVVKELFSAQTSRIKASLTINLNGHDVLIYQLKPIKK